MDANLVALLYLVAGALFILALRELSSRETSRRGNLLGMIGMAIAIVTPSGQSRKRDHDKVDQFLNQVVEPLLYEAAARLDPTVNSIVTPYGVGYTGLFQTVAANCG